MRSRTQTANQPATLVVASTREWDSHLDPQDWLRRIKALAPPRDHRSPALHIYVGSDVGLVDIEKIAAETLLSALDNHHRSGVDNIIELAHLRTFSYAELALGRVHIFL
jgi:hypothetical protein